MTLLEISKWELIMRYVYEHQIVSDDTLSYTDISFRTRITYSHVVQLMNELSNHKLVIIGKKNGRTYNVRLSSKGMKIGECISTIHHEMKL